MLLLFIDTLRQCALGMRRPPGLRCVSGNPRTVDNQDDLAVPRSTFFTIATFFLIRARSRTRHLHKIRGPGVALGLVTPFARAARTVLRGASRGFPAVLVARLRRGVGKRGFAAN